MGNLSYCRFENTAKDLRDCLEHFDEDLEGYEFKARNKIVQLAKQIVDEFGDEEFKEIKDDEDEDEDED